ADARSPLLGHHHLPPHGQRKQVAFQSIEFQLRASGVHFFFAYAGAFSFVIEDCRGVPRAKLRLP
ncbi:MAG: hypothetical protein WA802_00015, partial [Terracidiphilus sp.]